MEQSEVNLGENMLIFRQCMALGVTYRCPLSHWYIRWKV